MAYYRLRAQFFVSPDGAITPKVAKQLPYKDQIKIYERDGWACQLCGVKVKYGGRYDTPFNGPPWCGSIDHILPVSRGGSHHESNLRVACKSCNSSRKAAI
jgi:5-methylcytosine-specific restriction endonuclease McrA